MAVSTPPAAPTPYRRKLVRWLSVKEHIAGYLFIFPAVAIVTLFGIFPIGYAFYMSFFQWRIGKPASEQKFIEDENYIKAIGDYSGLAIFLGGVLLFALAYWLWNSAFRAASNRALVMKLLASVLLFGGGFVLLQGWQHMVSTGDKTFLHSLPVTLYYSLATVPAEIAIALILAYILFQKIRGQEFFRMLYFLPYITPLVAAAVVFRTIFSPRPTSLANRFLEMFGLDPQKWLTDPRTIPQVLFGKDIPDFLAIGPSMALVSIALFGIWTYVGYNTVIFLAGLGSIPPELYEAAEIDGAGKYHLFRHITLPLLSPVTFYLALIAFIGTFKAFNHIYVMREPGAQTTVDVTSVLIFDTFYRKSMYGYAASQAIILFVIILGLTYVQNKVFGEKVFYG